MKKILLAVSCLLLGLSGIMAQKKDSTKKKDTLITLKVDLKEQKAFLQLQVDKGQIVIDKLPDSMIICFPGVKPDGFSVQFNEDVKKKFKLVFDEGTDNDSTVFIQYNLLENGKLKLIFRNNQLVQIAGRKTLVNKDVVPNKDKKPFIKIIAPDKLAETHKSAFDALITSAEQKNDLKPEDFLDPSVFYTVTAPVADPNSLKPIDKNDRLEFVRTDHRDTLLSYKFSNKKNILKVVTVLRPKAEHILDVAILGPADSVYSVKSTGQDYFQEMNSTAEKSLPSTTPAISAKGDSTATASTGALAVKNTSADKIAAAKQITKQAVSSKGTDWSFVEKLKSDPFTRSFALSMDKEKLQKANPDSARALLNEYYMMMDQTVDALSQQKQKLSKKDSGKKELVLPNDHDAVTQRQ